MFKALWYRYDKDLGHICYMSDGVEKVSYEFRMGVSLFDNNPRWYCIKTEKTVQFADVRVS